jgi:hypothetical protein
VRVAAMQLGLVGAYGVGFFHGGVGALKIGRQYT